MNKAKYISSGKNVKSNLSEHNKEQNTNKKCYILGTVSMGLIFFLLFMINPLYGLEFLFILMILMGICG